MHQNQSSILGLANSTINFFVVFLLIIMAAIMMTGGVAITVFNQPISITHIVNPFIACYLLLYLKYFINPQWQQRINHGTIQLIQQPRALTIVFTVILLAIAGLITMYRFYPKAELWNLDAEQGLGTLVSGALLMVAAFFATMNYTEEKKAKQPNYFIWLLIALMFHYLAMDEIAFIHEKMSSFETIKLPFLNNPTLKHMEWLIVYSPLILTGVGSLIYFAWKKINSRPMLMLYVSALACYVLAITSEGLMLGLRWDSSSFYTLQVTIEEGLELVGTALFGLCFALYQQKGQLNKTA